MFLSLELRRTPGSPDSRESARAPASDARLGTEREARVVCTACGGFVTAPSARTSVEGRHRHRFMNPEGLHFEIACYATAPGTAGVGERSSVWTWFPGFLWQAVVCRGCTRHIGWFYSGGSTSFFGLISDRIVETDGSDAKPR